MTYVYIRLWWHVANIGGCHDPGPSGELQESPSKMGGDAAPMQLTSTREFQLEAHIWPWVSTNGIPFWLVGEFTTHFRTCFSGDWDVHWGYAFPRTQGRQDTSGSRMAGVQRGKNTRPTTLPQDAKLTFGLQCRGGGGWVVGILEVQRGAFFVQPTDQCLYVEQLRLVPIPKSMAQFP